jgi:hypothetical protein
MEFGRSFSYQFNDPDWIKKIALVALISLIPLVGQFFVLGWGLEITRRVLSREAELLPEIDFGRFLGKGFQAFLVGLVYAIPLLIFYIPIVATPFIGAMADSGNGNGSGIASTIAMIFGLCCGGLMFIYGIAMAFIIPAALGRLADRGTVGAALKFGDVIGLVRAAPVAYLIVALGTMIGGFISSLGMIACGIGILVTTVYSITISSHLMGQAYREAAHI